MIEPIVRERHSILVVEAHAIGMIGVIRSLGLAGYKVHAVSSNKGALGLQSSFCERATVHPDYKSSKFIPWLESYIKNYKISVIIPSEGFLFACAPCYEKIRKYLPDAVNKDVLQRCMSKVETHECLAGNDKTASNIPPTKIIYNENNIPKQSEIKNTHGPYYIKGDKYLANNKDTDAVVIRCTSLRGLIQTLQNIVPAYKAVVFQQYATGHKVGVSLWRHNGEVLAENMTLGIHMNPWHGGMMSLRKTFWHPALLEDAKIKMEALDWQGVAMMEYTWDADKNEFYFIEINARYWGYLHLDLFSGKDFPLLQVDAFLGHQRSSLGLPKKNVTCRYTIPGETGYLLSTLRSKSLSNRNKVLSFIGFFANFFNPCIYSDLMFPGDRRLYWIGFWRFMKNAIK